MITLDPRNGAHIYPTRLAIDRHVIIDKETEKPTVIWRLLEINSATQRYSVVNVSTNSLQIAAELTCSYLMLSHHFKAPEDIRTTFNDMLKTCLSAISIISQHAAMDAVQHG